VSREDLEAILPNFAEDGCEVTSDESSNYNCFAWAADDLNNWWQPPDPRLDLFDPIQTRFWPVSPAPREVTVESVIGAYASYGYALCDMGDLEPGIEKLAIYVHEVTGLPTHVARQLDSGRWTSKIGVLEDIEHDTLLGVASPLYGQATQFLKRPRGDSVPMAGDLRDAAGATGTSSPGDGA